MSCSVNMVREDEDTFKAASPLKKQPVDPILQNALRYTISADEYKRLHAYLVSRAPHVHKRVPEPRRFEKSVTHTQDDTVATIRESLRVFLISYGGFHTWELVSTWMRARKGKHTRPTPNNSSLRHASALSLILLFHRLLRRFLLRMRDSLLQNSSQGFRRRNPLVSGALTSHYGPSLGAAIAGLFLTIAPKSQLRVTVAIYAMTRALEFAYNVANDQNLIWGRNGKPSWVGSWMFVPFAYAQLLHAFVFDRDCFPDTFGNFILERSPEYIQKRPTDLPTSMPWPSTNSIVDGLAQLSRLRWPDFTSPILFPNAKQPLPRSVAGLSPIAASAHPLIKHTSCALLHPDDPSCARTYIKYWFASFPRTARLFTFIYGAFAVLSYKSLLADPWSTLNTLAARILRMSLFVTGAIGTSWGSICLFANYLPRNFLHTQRWLLGGFLGGLWAFVVRKQERSSFLYSVRLAIDSFWKVGVKKGWWSGFKHGDVLLFAASLAIINSVYDANPRAVKGKIVRKSLGVLRGEGWVDRAALSADESHAQGDAAMERDKVHEE